METTRRKLVTIITEAVLERQIAQDVKRLGAKGYTITQARGEGSKGLRRADFDLGSNIRIEVVCTQAVAEAIVTHLMKVYYQSYAMIVYLADVEVLRPEKF
ncbi:MAG: transcriptional regulator [Chloroflexi bacterium]|nr:transcriptional regulator [Chloroflexota bacterium]